MTFQSSDQPERMFISLGIGFLNVHHTNDIVLDSWNAISRGAVRKGFDISVDRQVFGEAERASLKEGTKRNASRPLPYLGLGMPGVAGQMSVEEIGGNEKAPTQEQTSDLDLLNSPGNLHSDKLDMTENVFNRILSKNEKAFGADRSSPPSTVSTAMSYLETSDPGLTDGSTAPTLTDFNLSEVECSAINVCRPHPDKDDADLLDNDVASVWSVEDEITTPGATRKQRNSKALEAELVLGRAFAKNEELAALCKNALSRIQHDRFVNNFRRLLKSYHMDLLQESISVTEKECVNLVKGSMARTRIASVLADSIESEEPIEEGWSDTAAAREKEGIEAVERWLSLANEGSKSRGPPEDVVTEVHPLADNPTADERLTNEDEPPKPYAPMQIPNIEEAKRFLFGGIAFRRLLCNTQTFLIPAQLAPLCRVLMTTPSNDISFRYSEQLPKLDKLKVFLEDISNSKWDWWPWEPPERQLSEGYVRIHWQCVSRSFPPLIHYWNN